MDEPIESTYFNWLCAKVLLLENATPSLTYWDLLRELHNTEFVWLISGDDNRAEDGRDLRIEFLRESYLETEDDWMHVSCSILEMFIAFARRAAFETDCSPADWFWEFIENLGLAEFNDAYRLNPENVSDILYRFVWRTYDFNGRGGMFPLHMARYDQRKVEIWYQFNYYLVDQEQHQ